MKESIRGPRREAFLIERIARPCGVLQIDVWKRGKLLYTREHKNLVVNGVVGPLAQLLGGDVSNQSCSAIGFGSGSSGPLVSDTTLTSQAYFKALDSHSYPTVGSVQFNWSLQNTDYGAQGMSLVEFGLFANTGAAVLPIAVGTSFPTWTANHNYPADGTQVITDSNGNIEASIALPLWVASTVEQIGNCIVDSNGNIQKVTAVSSDQKTGSSAPTWATVVSSTTTDNHVTWTLEVLGTTGQSAGSHPTWPTTVPNTVFDGTVLWELSSKGGSIPTMTLLSRIVLKNGLGVPQPISFTSGMSISGTWTETF